MVIVQWSFFLNLIEIWHSPESTVSVLLCHLYHSSAQPPDITPDIQTHGHLSVTSKISEKHSVRNAFRCEIFGLWQSLVTEPAGFYFGPRCGCNEVLICFISMERGCKGERSRWVWRV